MTVSELFQKALDIEAKYTPNSSLSMHISTSTSGKGIAKYKLQHDATGRSVDTGYGITNISKKDNHGVTLIVNKPKMPCPIF